MKSIKMFQNNDTPVFVGDSKRIGSFSHLQTSNTCNIATTSVF